MRVLLALTMALPALAQQMNFVACPVVRDTKTVPCFLADYQGETYFLGIQQDITADFYPPQLLHEVLVEGTVVPGPRVCGGIPLKPLHVSVLRGIEPGVQHHPAGRAWNRRSARQAPRRTIHASGSRLHRRGSAQETRTSVPGARVHHSI